VVFPAPAQQKLLRGFVACQVKGIFSALVKSNLVVKISPAGIWWRDPAPQGQKTMEALSPMGRAGNGQFRYCPL